MPPLFTDIATIGFLSTTKITGGGLYGIDSGFGRGIFLVFIPLLILSAHLLPDLCALSLLKRVKGDPPDRHETDDADHDQQLDQRETLSTYPEVSFSDGHWVTQGAWGCID